MRVSLFVLLAAFVCTGIIGCSGGGNSAALVESKKPVVKGKGGGNATPAEGPAPPIVKP